MPRHVCLLCRRTLRDPVSVKMGIGPICRGRDSKQKEFDFMRARFQLLDHVPGKYIFIIDVGHASGRSVTTDVEYVIDYLYQHYSTMDGTRIFYKDSHDNIDEILHSGKKFKGFKPGHDGVDLGRFKKGA